MSDESDKAIDALSTFAEDLKAVGIKPAESGFTVKLSEERRVQVARAAIDIGVLVERIKRLSGVKDEP